MFRHINFQSLGVTDMERAVTFYRDVMGLTVEVDAPYGEGRWVFMGLPGGNTRLHFDQQDAVAPQKTPSLILVTDNVDATCETLQSRGVRIDKGPEDAPWDPGTRWAIIHDSEGNMVLIQTIGGNNG